MARIALRNVHLGDDIPKLALLASGLLLLPIAACDRSGERAGGEASYTILADSVPAESGVRGVYLGLGIREPWFIYLEPGSSASGMYQPYRSVAVCDVRTDPSGTLTFRSAKTRDGTAYQFVGRLSHDSLTGTAIRVGTRTGAVVESTSIALRRVPARFLTGLADSLSGDYNQMEQNEQGGDISGTEVVLVDLVNRVVGFAQDYDGGPTTVWEITGKRVRDTLHLTWRSPEHVSVDTLLIRGDTLRTFHSDFRAVRRLSLSELFRGPHRSECD